MPFRQSTHTVVMVPPLDFGFNAQTALDNQFQNPPDQNREEIRELANREFDAMVVKLRQAGVQVLLLHAPGSGEGELPDAVFSNNWFSTDSNGTLFLFPMAVESRRREVCPEELETLLTRGGFEFRQRRRIEGAEGVYLEGTGSLVIDHIHRKIFAASSLRCHPQLFERFCLEYGFAGILFETRSSSQSPIYHTNVVMSVGTDFAVICLAAIHDSSQRSQVLESIGSRSIIEISLQQMERFFCGNILELNSVGGDPLILMSENARYGFTGDQIAKLEGFGKIIAVSIPTIEKVGGGSARCMVAEVFLPRKKKE